MGGRGVSSEELPEWIVKPCIVGMLLWCREKSFESLDFVSGK
jgi:hypothetical protein